MFNKFLSLILVVSFSFLLIPTDIWHTCEEKHITEHHNTENTDDVSFEENHTTCAICDFDLFQLSIEETLATNFIKQVYKLDVKNSISQFLANLNSKFNKGPPVFIL
jgi:hypothetical protein